MYKNSEKFLAAFNRIEKALRQELQNSKGIGFAKAVKILAKYNSIVSKYSDDLLEYAELRNAIVHDKIDTMHAIAEPHDSVVKHIEKIEKDITQPKVVIPMFSRRVVSFQVKDSLSDVLEAIHEKGFSKFPVYYEDEFKGLFTESAITKWLADNKFSSGSETLIEEILPYQKNSNFKFIGRDTTVYEAIGIFKDQIEKGNRIDALLITENGKNSEELLGIITSWDMMGIQS
ncbi:CBS domain-containing protein [Ornithinibacillus sp. L9]|uniref:CBS domain-containing protein n=1 Tax=Ornithinibacillus caprae TaxID=2678566 RepID=A0A6N8FHE7_9BACI|nr:CBS domain-containing protein [Ornithinibacillus caprae]MUK88863.1 CBS domain-containing protein [Ornithinibacillus caprae]